MRIAAWNVPHAPQANSAGKLAVSAKIVSQAHIPTPRPGALVRIVLRARTTSSRGKIRARRARPAPPTPTHQGLGSTPPLGANVSVVITPSGQGMRKEGKRGQAQGNALLAPTILWYFKIGMRLDHGRVNVRMDSTEAQQTQTTSNARRVLTTRIRMTG